MRISADAAAAALPRRDLVRARGRRRLAVAAAAVTAAAGAGGFAALRASDVFAVEHVAVQGASPRLERELQAAAAAVAGGENLLALDVGLVERTVEARPFVRDVRVDRAFPHTLRLVVDAYRPAALVQVGAGEEAAAYVVAADGQVLAERAVPADEAGRGRAPSGRPRILLPAGAPLVVGRHDGHADLTAALQVIATVSANAGPRLGRVAEVAWHGGMLAARVDHGVSLRLGDASDLALKTRAARRVVRRFSDQQLRATAYVDVSVPERPALGLRS